MIFFNVHTHFKDDLFSIYNAQCLDDVPEKGFYSLGVHPWFIKEKSDLLSKQLHQRCLAIGEIGLDRVFAKKNPECSFDRQKILFKEQLLRAKQLSKPVIIHCVRAYDECLRIIKETSFQGYCIFHDYNAGNEITSRLLKYENVYFSLGKRFMLGSVKLVSSLNLLPLERIFFETDESKFEIKDVYKAYALKQGVSLNQVCEQVRMNVNQVFKIKV